MDLGSLSCFLKDNQKIILFLFTCLFVLDVSDQIDNHGFVYRCSKGSVVVLENSELLCLSHAAQLGVKYCSLSFKQMQKKIIDRVCHE